MPSRAEIVSSGDSPPPRGADPWLSGAAPATGIEVTDPDRARPRHYDDLASRIREALGWRVPQLEHVGSTAVPGLAAKPVIDIDLTVADPGCEQDYVPVLETAGFRLVIREPWWYGHRAYPGQPRPRLRRERSRKATSQGARGQAQLGCRREALIAVRSAEAVYECSSTVRHAAPARCTAC